MKQFRTKFAVLLTLASLLLLSGCGTDEYRNEYASAYARHKTEHNVLGLVKVDEESYAPTSESSLNLSTKDITSRKNISGDRVSLLWGLVTITDY